MTDDSVPPIFPLRYRLPKTVLSVGVTTGEEFVEIEHGHVLRPRLDVSLTSTVIPDPDGDVAAELKQGFLEKLSMTVSLSEGGLLESVNTQAGRDPSPIIGLVAKLIPLATLLFIDRDRSKKTTLEQDWAACHQELAANYADLEARIKTTMQDLVQSHTAGGVAEIGTALDVLRRELALIDRVRREWMSGRPTHTETVVSTFAPREAMVLPQEDLPDSLPIDPEQLPAAIQGLAEYGIAVVVADPFTLDDAQRPPEEDVLMVRRPRPVRVGIYRDPERTLDPEADLPSEVGAGPVEVIELGTSVTDEKAREWKLTQSVSVQVVDSASLIETISLRGQWWRERTVELSFHPDRTIKSYGLTSASTVGAVATAAGGVLDAVAAAGKALGERPSAEELAFDKAKRQLDMAKTGSEMAQLAATQERAVELAELEQRAKLAELQSKLQASSVP